MEFFAKTVEVVGTAVIAMGTGLAIWGAIGLFEGYSSDNAGSKSQGVKQLFGGAGIAIIGLKVIPMLASMF